MALREYTDRNHVRWAVWDIAPRYTPMRSGVDRRRCVAAPHQPERRRPADRRRRSVEPLVLHGWLCFESEGERRRLSPIPSDWEQCPEAVLEQYGRAAQPVRRSEPSLLAS